MVFRRNLRKILRLGNVGLVTTDAELGSIQFCGLDRRRIVSMLGQRPMARFAGHAFVDAFALDLEHICVTALADLVSGIGNRECRNLSHRISPIVSVLSKTARDEETAHNQEQHKTRHENGCQAEEVFRIFEALHRGK
jgi:hypothetical protein